MRYRAISRGWAFRPKEGVQSPTALVDIFCVRVDGIDETEGGGFSIGANVHNMEPRHLYSFVRDASGAAACPVRRASAYR